VKSSKPSTVYIKIVSIEHVNFLSPYLKNTVVELLIISTHYLQSRLKALVDYIACTIEPIREGRSYDRPKSKIKNKLHFCNYKRAK
jgi:hypothetical protein